jgi:low affinity Fe/Cu permease
MRHGRSAKPNSQRRKLVPNSRKWNCSSQAGIVRKEHERIAEMAKRQSGKGPAAAGKPATGPAADPARVNGHPGLFSRLASQTSHYAGKPLTFLIAVGVVIVWAFCGPLFGFSDTWQLVINTGTTIITFLMVFLIQNTQNRDTLALQVKLAELIIAAQGAKNDVASAEDLSEEELEQLHENYRRQAEAACAHLERRRDSRIRKAG